ncbi:hypothetical protein [Deinococcus ruber]|uniref:hypothetical protein n=1 Tax=Deinococcus ruber TaxID=1848197 RepID=UPI001E64F984|nr:hypothetical protein [Deinococcus ruber]
MSHTPGIKVHGMPDQMFVGIDVSKARLDVVVLPSGEVFAVDNTASGLTELLIRLSDLQPQLVVLEAIGCDVGAA